jgi:response regulator RpfG family c-di-GMP phosphodiesterase
MWQKCPKYGILVTGCTHNLECVKCVGKVKAEKPIKPVKAPKIKTRGKHTKKKKTVKRTKKNTIKRGLKTNKVQKSGGRHVRRIKRTATKKCSMDSGRFGSLFGY